MGPSPALMLAASLCVARGDPFSEWQVRHGRRYRTPEELEYRRGVFLSNLAYISRHNAGSPRYTLAPNPFADLTVGEWASSSFVGGYRPREGDWGDERPVPQAVPANTSSSTGGAAPTRRAIRRPDSGDPAQGGGWGSPPAAGGEEGGGGATLTPSPDPYRWPFGPPLTTSRALQGGPAGVAPLPAVSPAATSTSSGSALPDLAPVGWGWDAVWPWAPSRAPTPSPFPSPPAASSTPSSSPFPSTPGGAAPPTPTAVPMDNGLVEPLTPLPDGLPEAVDWTTHPWLSGAWPVRNQAGCGACFAFSIIGSIEAALTIRDAAAAGVGRGDAPSGTGSPRYSLSEQQVLDCSSNTCAGGGLRVTWRYVRDAGGVCSSAAYPYTAQKGDCLSVCGEGAQRGNVTGWMNVPRQDEVALLRALLVGPVVVAIQASQQQFMFYRSGVLDDEGCGTGLDHAVVAVGYGVDSVTGQAFFKLRNSWGPSWGEGGYIRIARGGRFNPTGQCGVQMDPTYPILAP